MYFIKTPNIIRSYFKNYVWSINTNKKEIYLTFDDGPTSKVTPFVLQILKEYQAKATFFCVGENIQKHPEIIKQLINDGHSLGNHTQSHLNGWKTKNKTYLESILKCELKINKYKSNTKDQRVSIFRPPYGKIKKTQAKILQSKGHNIIMWSVLSGDFDLKISKEKCLKNVLKNTKKGSIIVFHDSIKASKNLEYTLPKVLDYFSKKGFVFKAI